MAAKSDVFEYTIDGKKITLPLLNKLKFGVMRKIRKESEMEQMFMLVEMVADEKALDLIDEMDADEAGEFMQEWQKASGLEVGESDE